MSTAMLTEAQRHVVQAVMDRLIPAVDELPGAGTMGLLEEVERLIADHNRYGRALVQFLEALSDVMSSSENRSFPALDGAQQDQTIQKVEQALPQDFATVLEVVCLAYYNEPQVHARIGWHGGAPQPAGFALPPFDEALLDTARQRPPFWRQD